jgi:hypothetical protein
MLGTLNSFWEEILLLDPLTKKPSGVTFMRINFVFCEVVFGGRVLVKDRSNSV